MAFTAQSIPPLFRPKVAPFELSFNDALAILKPICDNLEESEKLRLLEYFNMPRAAEVRSALYQAKKNGGGPKGDDSAEKKILMAISGKQ